MNQKDKKQTQKPSPRAAKGAQREKKYEDKGLKEPSEQVKEATELVDLYRGYLGNTKVTAFFNRLSFGTQLKVAEMAPIGSSLSLIERLNVIRKSLGQEEAVDYEDPYKEVYKEFYDVKNRYKTYWDYMESLEDSEPDGKQEEVSERVLDKKKEYPLNKTSQEEEVEYPLNKTIQEEDPYTGAVADTINIVGAAVLPYSERIGGKLIRGNVLWGRFRDLPTQLQESVLEIREYMGKDVPLSIKELRGVVENILFQNHESMNETQIKDLLSAQSWVANTFYHFNSSASKRKKMKNTNKYYCLIENRDELVILRESAKIKGYGCEDLDFSKFSYLDSKRHINRYFVTVDIKTKELKWVISYGKNHEGEQELVSLGTRVPLEAFLGTIGVDMEEAITSIKKSIKKKLGEEVIKINDIECPVSLFEEITETKLEDFLMSLYFEMGIEV